MSSQDSFSCQRSLQANGKDYQYFSIPDAQEGGLGDVSRLPFSLKVLLENLLRHEDGKTVTKQDIEAIAKWQEKRSSNHEIAYRPVRVLMQDFTGVPAIVDLAAMRSAVEALGGDPEQINPLSPVDLVIDHSVQVDFFASDEAYRKNVDKEMERNRERYEFLRWGQTAFKNFRVVPPGTGICHQVNLEYLGKTVWSQDQDGKTFAFPDTLVGTDSHTTMINGLGILGWGVGGIEAEAAMLGQPISMLIPEVIGFKLTGELMEGVTATDLVLTVTQMLREKGVVGKFVEFYGPGLAKLPLADRATISNMAPEYGATCGFFPVDQETINYLRLSGRDEETLALVEAYCRAQGMWLGADTPEPIFTDGLELDLSQVVPSLAGPKRPQDRVAMTELDVCFKQILEDAGRASGAPQSAPVEGKDYQLEDGAVVIAAITSCTNTSNPSVLMAAGLVAKKALEKGLQVKPWVKTSFAPGSKVVTEYLEKADLQNCLDQLGFNTVGYGCTTCIGNSGPLPQEISKAIDAGDLVVSAVLSGNRNFEGRIHQQTKANWLASPPLVVAYALAGHTRLNLAKDPIGQDKDGNDVFLKDIWPSSAEVAAEVSKVDRGMFQREYAEVFKGDASWNSMAIGEGKTYQWNAQSTYVQHPPFFQGLTLDVPKTEDVKGAGVLALLGDSITTDHISPAGAISTRSPAGEYLVNKEVQPVAFNSYGSRRGNHEVMMRGTFANIRIRNEMAPGTEGGYTTHYPSGEVMSIYDAAMRYEKEGKPLVVIAGKEYGTGSSRDWAAKGTRLLGAKAVIAESYERIHRSNLIGMGVLPLQFPEGVNRKTLKLDGTETVDVEGVSGGITPGMDVKVTIHRQDGSSESFKALCRIDTSNEVEYFLNGGILHYVLRNIVSGATAG